MSNITLAMDKKLIEQGRTYAQRNGMSLNELIRKLLRDAIEPKPDSLEGLWAIADSAGGGSKGQSWTREDAYDSSRIG